MTFPKPPEARDSTNGAPQLRQRQSVKSPVYTIAEEDDQPTQQDASPPPPTRALRRTSSILTDGSSSFDDRRTSFRSSGESLLLPPRATGYEEPLHEEPSLWYSAPLLFAILPAIGGVAFKKGSVLLTDVALLALAAVYLNWCLVTPWIWYHSARSVSKAEPPMEGEISEEALQEESEDVKNDNESTTPKAGQYDEETDTKPPPKDPGMIHPAAAVSDESTMTREASAELAMHELVALAMCVFGPLVGSYILHVVRESLLSLHGGQLVSNMHLTLFVLGAELRPVRHCIKLVQARTLHLQRVVRSDPHFSESKGCLPEVVADFGERLAELEASVASSAEQLSKPPARADPVATPNDIKHAQQALQAQIDAVTRAVRRYEKRETARTLQTEERMQDLEARLREALSLAAAAAQNSQKNGLFSTIVKWIWTWLQLGFEILLWPAKWFSDLGWSVLKKLGLARPLRRRRPVKRPSDSGREAKEKEKWLKRREDGVARPISDAWLKGRR